MTSWDDGFSRPAQAGLVSSAPSTTAPAPSGAGLEAALRPLLSPSGGLLSARSVPAFCQLLSSTRNRLDPDWVVFLAVLRRSDVATGAAALEDSALGVICGWLSDLGSDTSTAAASFLTKVLTDDMPALPVTGEALRTQKAGLVVKGLKKHSDPAVQRAAELLVYSWRNRVVAETAAHPHPQPAVAGAKRPREDGLGLDGHGNGDADHNGGAAQPAAAAAGAGRPAAVLKLPAAAAAGGARGLRGFPQSLSAIIGGLGSGSTSSSTPREPESADSPREPEREREAAAAMQPPKPKRRKGLKVSFVPDDKLVTVRLFLQQDETAAVKADRWLEDRDDFHQGLYEIIRQEKEAKELAARGAVGHELFSAAALREHRLERDAMQTLHNETATILEQLKQMHETTGWYEPIATYIDPAWGIRAGEESTLCREHDPSSVPLVTLLGLPGHAPPPPPAPQQQTTQYGVPPPPKVAAVAPSPLPPAPAPLIPSQQYGAPPPPQQQPPAPAAYNPYAAAPQHQHQHQPPPPTQQLQVQAPQAAPYSYGAPPHPAAGAPPPPPPRAAQSLSQPAPMQQQQHVPVAQPQLPAMDPLADAGLLEEVLGLDDGLMETLNSLANDQDILRVTSSGAAATHANQPAPAYGAPPQPAQQYGQATHPPYYQGQGRGPGRGGYNPGRGGRGEVGGGYPGGPQGGRMPGGGRGAGFPGGRGAGHAGRDGAAGRGNNMGRGVPEGHPSFRSVPCRYYHSNQGCKLGDRCTYKHA